LQLYKEKAIKIAGDEEKHRIAREKAEDEAVAAKEAKAKALLEECHKSRQCQVKIYFLKYTQHTMNIFGSSILIKLFEIY